MCDKSGMCQFVECDVFCQFELIIGKKKLLLACCDLCVSDDEMVTCMSTVKLRHKHFGIQMPLGKLFFIFVQLVSLLSKFA